MPLVAACRTSHLFVFVFIVYGHSDYFFIFIILFFIVYYYYFLIGVYRFDGSAFMRVVFMYRAAEDTEFDSADSFHTSNSSGILALHRFGLTNVNP